MRARRIALYTTGGLIAVLVAVIAWAWFADLGVLKPQIERWVTEKTGRTFVIEGPLSIDLAGQTVVVAEGVRLQNASWDTPDDMVELDRVEVRLDLGSLFGDGPVIIDLVDVDGLRAVLTRRDDGAANWTMGTSDEPAAESTEPGKGVVLRQATVDSSRLQYSAPSRNEPLVLTVDSLNHQHRDDDFLDLNFAGSLSDEDLTVDGEIGTWPNLLAANNVQYALDVSLGDFDVYSEGTIDDLRQPARPTLSFTARGPDIDELTRALKIGEDGSGDINLSGSLGPGGQGDLVLDVDGNLGRTQIDASGAFSDLRDLENFDMLVSLAGPDVRPVLGLIGIRDDQSEPFDLQFEARRDGSALIIEKATAHVGSAELHFAATVPQFPEVQDSVVSLTIQGPHIERFRELLSIPGVVTGPFSLGFTMDIDDTGIHILNLGMETELARMTANGGLGRAPDYFGTSLNFDLQTDDLGRMAAAYGIENFPAEPAAVTGEFAYTPDGIETRSEFSSVTGETRVLLDGTIATVPGVVGTDVTFAAEGQHLSDFLEAFGANRGVPRAPYRLDGRLRVEEAAYVFQEVAGFIGASRVTLDGRLVPVEGLAGSAFAIGVDGDALEEIVNTLSDFDVAPGPYAVDGNVQFTAEGLEVPNLKLTRPAGEVTVVATLTPDRSDIQLNAAGPNVQSVMRHFDGIHFDAAPFTMTLDAAKEGALIDVDELDILIGELQITAVGDVELAGDASGTNFAFNLEVPDLSAVGEFGDFRFLPQPATASARVVGADSVLRVDDLKVALGDSDLRGRLTYALGEVPDLNVDLDADRIVLLEREDPPEESAEDDESPAETPVVAEEPVDDGRLIPDIPLSGDRLRSMNAVVDVDIGHFEYGALLLRDFDLEASLQSGLLVVSRLAALGESGGFALQSRVEPQEVGVSATLDVAAQDFALGLGELNEDLGMTADVQISLSSTGADVRALLGNSNGITFIETRGGRFENTGLANLFFNDALQQIFSAINPFRKTDPYTTLECVVATSEVVDGVAASTPSSLVSTDKILITLKSAIDLKSEGLELNVRTTPHKGITISASEILNPYIKVVGTLKEPSLAVDEAGVLLSGGAAVVTGGLSVLAKAAITRLSKSNDPCGDAAAEAIEVLGDRFPQLEVPMPTTIDGDEHPAEGTESISPPDQTDP